jgi:predicted molibdopterin-dependent oxidoreductase YjgC
MTAGGAFFWRGMPVPFRRGESIAAALAGIGVHAFGGDPSGAATRYFCGIGACQCCLVRVNGLTKEACLEPAEENIRVTALEDGDA